MNIDAGAVKKLLLIQLRAIGDVVQTTAVLPLLRQTFPRAQIHFLTGPGVNELLTGLPELNKVLVYPYAPRETLGVIKFLPTLRREQYDLVIDFQGTPGTALLSYFSGAPWRLGWEIRHRRWAYTHRSRANRKREYVAIQKCRLLQPLGIEAVNTRLQVAVLPEALETVERYFSEQQIDPRRLLVNISPKGKRPARQWFPEKIARLTDLLVEKHRAQVFYNWAPGERDAVEAVARRVKTEVRVLPGWSLATFAAFLSRVDLHFSYDNGPKHIAMAVGTPTLSLFATDPPELWNPLNDPDHPFLEADVPCKHCGLRECDLMICMKAIEPEDVLRKIEQIPALQGKLLWR